MTVKELKETLTAKGVSLPTNAKKAELEALLAETIEAEKKPVIKIVACDADTLETYLNTEKEVVSEIEGAVQRLTEHYLAICERHNLLKENGLPTQSAKQLVHMFHDWPLNTNNELKGIEDAKKEHKGAAFLKRAYMALNKAKKTAEFNAMSPEEQEKAKAKKAGKGKDKDKAQPEVLTKESVMAYLKRNPAIAFDFVVQTIGTLSANPNLTFACAEVQDAIDQLRDIAEI